MNVFCYDKSLEGLLTAVFDAFNRRVLPEALITDGEPAPMFAGEVYRVYSDIEKSGRVWSGLQRKLPREVLNMLMCVWLSEEAGSDMLLFRYICKVFSSSHSIITDFTDCDVLEVKKIAQRVSRDSMRIKQFLRFQKTSDDTFFAAVVPDHNSLPLVIDFFRDRFADQRWIIYDLKRRYGYYYDLAEVTEITLSKDDDLINGKLSDSMMADDEKQFQQMWKTYYKALTIKERINPRQQKSYMPRRFWRYMTEHQE